jgi:hypothetical protein
VKLVATFGYMNNIELVRVTFLILIVTISHTCVLENIKVKKKEAINKSSLHFFLKYNKKVDTHLSMSHIYPIHEIKK